MNSGIHTGNNNWSNSNKVNIMETKTEKWKGMEVIMIKRLSRNIWNRDLKFPWRLFKNRREIEKRRRKEDWIIQDRSWMERCPIPTGRGMITLPPNSHFRWRHHNNTILTIQGTAPIHQELTKSTDTEVEADHLECIPTEVLDNWAAM